MSLKAKKRAKYRKEKELLDTILLCCGRYLGSTENESNLDTYKEIKKYIDKRQKKLAKKYEKVKKQGTYVGKGV